MYQNVFGRVESSAMPVIQKKTEIRELFVCGEGKSSSPDNCGTREIAFDAVK